MSWRTKRIKLGACMVGALTAGVLAVSTTPAAASGTYSGLAYIYGAGNFTDDLNNEGVLSTSTHKYSNATCLWQKILWADGYLTSTADIDGIFGTNTYNATKRWQADMAMQADGAVGKATFTRVGAFVDYVNGSEASGANLTVSYWGQKYDVTLVRDSDGNYNFMDGTGTWRKAGYNYRSCS